jgi:hypothetical protein
MTPWSSANLSRSRTGSPSSLIQIRPSSRLSAGYPKQCSDAAAAAASGATLPDYVGDLASCNADPATTTTDLTTCEGDLAACEALPPARLLQTGQTTSYGAGSDGDLQLGIAQGYVDNGDGTIHDKDNTYSWSGASYGSTNEMDGTLATTFLAALNVGGGFAGHTDWRLPNQTELYSLVNLEIGYPGPVVFPEFDGNCGANSSGNPGCTVTTCSCTAPSYYWSSSSYASNPQFAWLVYFNYGSTGGNGKNNRVHVRAVRGGS